MNSTDDILNFIFNSKSISLNSSVPSRDKKILVSLWRQLSAGHFLTENQGKLLVKILNENLAHLNFKDYQITELITTPVWSQPFRRIEHTRKIYLSDSEEKSIIVEFTYNKSIKDKLNKLIKEIDGNVVTLGNRKLSIALTEKNISILYKNFKPFNFSFDEKILNFYQEITTILKSKDTVFDFNNIENKKLNDILMSDIGVDYIDHPQLLHDRKMRYQYQFFGEKTGLTLTDKIAYRLKHKIFINKQTTELINIIRSLVELKRLPLLFIFPGHEAKESIDDLRKMQESLEHLSLTDNVGIYFRFDNVNESNKTFNESINNFKFNTPLSQNTKIVGLANNKLPKFIVKDHWCPKSIISFTNNFKNNKSSVYFDNVDLIIYFNEKEPLGDIDVIV